VDDQLLHLLVQRWSAGLVVWGKVQAPATRRWCQRSSVSGMTTKQA
jgi:hypothetical protein